VPSRPKHPAQPLALDVGSPRAALVAGKGYFFASVRGSPHPTGPACSYADPCTSKIISARLHPARFANGRWPVPFRDAGLRGRRDGRSPGTVARGDICIHVGVSTNAHRLCRVLLALSHRTRTRTRTCTCILTGTHTHAYLARRGTHMTHADAHAKAHARRNARAHAEAHRYRCFYLLQYVAFRESLWVRALKHPACISNVR
jgi:hypothetical protein